MAKKASKPEPEVIHSVAISDIKIHEDPDRFRAGDVSIDELATSIHEHGLLQPILLATADEGLPFELVAGHRRLLAVKSLGLIAIGARILDLPPDASSIIRLTENIQREALSPLEEAVAVKRMRDEQGLTQEQAAERLAKGIAWVKHREALLRLPDDVMDALHGGSINPSVALQLGRIDDDQVRPYYLQSAIDYGATQDVAVAWVANWERDGSTPDSQELEESVEAYAHNPGDHLIQCHVCETGFPIHDIRTIFVCNEDALSIAGATRRVQEPA